MGGADLCLNVQQLEPAISDLQEQVLAPHPALGIHLLQLPQGIPGVLDFMCPQLTCHQVLRGKEVWREGAQVVVGKGGGKAAEDVFLASLSGRSQAIPIEKPSRADGRSVAAGLG